MNGLMLNQKKISSAATTNRMHIRYINTMINTRHVVKPYPFMWDARLDELSSVCVELCYRFCDRGQDTREDSEHSPDAK